MKLIHMRETANGLETGALILTVVQAPPQQGGLNAPTVRARARVLTSLETGRVKAGLLLEDKDHETLVDALNEFRFGLATRELDQILTDIIDAKAPSPIDNLEPVKPAAKPAPGAKGKEAAGKSKRKRN